MRKGNFSLFALILILLALLTYPKSAAMAAGRKWAVIVGINEYLKEVTPLHCAVKDAESFRKALIEKAGFSENDVFILTTRNKTGNRVPDKSNIIRWVSYVKQNAKPEDTFLFFFAGHGMDMGNQSYLLTYEADPYSHDTLDFSSLKVADLKRVIQEMPVSKIMLFIDACRSDPRSGKGDIDNKMTETQSKDLIIKGASSRQKTGADFSVTFFSCRVGERSYEWSEQGMGFFTYYLVKGLSGEAADSSGNVTLGSMKDYISKSVPGALIKERGQGMKQSPWMDGDYSPSARDWVFCGGVGKKGNKAATTTASREKSFGEPPETVREDPQEAEKHRIRGDEFSKRRDFGNAINEYNEALRFNPKDSLAYECLGKLYLKKSDFEKSIASYTKAIKLSPQNLDAHVARGMAYLKCKDYGKAISDLKKALELDPTNADTAMNLGIASGMNGDSESAIGFLTKSIELYGNNADAYLYRGMAFAEKRDWQKALTDFDKTLEINPGSATVHYYRGLAFEGIGHTKDAVDSYRRFLEMALPNDDKINAAKERLIKLGN